MPGLHQRPSYEHGRQGWHVPARRAAAARAAPRRGRQKMSARAQRGLGSGFAAPRTRHPAPAGARLLSRDRGPTHQGVDMPGLHQRPSYEHGRQGWHVPARRAAAARAAPRRARQKMSARARATSKRGAARGTPAVAPTPAPGRDSVHQEGRRVPVVFSERARCGVDAANWCGLVQGSARRAACRRAACKAKHKASIAPSGCPGAPTFRRSPGSS